MQTIQNAIPAGLGSASPNRQRSALRSVTPQSRADVNSPANPSTSSSAMRLASKTVTDALWVSMISMFGHKWVSQNGMVANGTNSDAWSAALYQLSPAQIAAGMNEVAQSGMKWPPSAPEFRAMCFSLPSLGRVKLESKPNAERSPFTIMVWQRLDGHRYRAETDPDKADRMMAEAYAVAREDVLKGVPLPEKPVAVIGFEKRCRPVPARRSVIGAELAKMASILGGVSA